MTALAHEVIPVADDEPVADLDTFLWETWKAMDLPEGYRAEIIEGSIEVSPTGRVRHGVLINRLRRRLESHLEGGEHAVHHDLNLIHQGKVWIPDLFIASADAVEDLGPTELGVAVATVEAAVEVVSPGRRNLERDRVRKRREYARAEIPLYILIDDFDGDGAVVLLTQPNPDKAVYEDEHRVPYGTDAVIPSGPAKGFAIGAAITAP
ncbi:Uma2 family endonuclease [Streptomyces sp. NPDC021100]|uniref:Uma2 family endonuclease n=1 Tax=Streptomyces sp. NPDC021100 TaxID=3365114 RepID=UPI0037AFB79E